MTEQNERLARTRAEIAARIARFKAMQEKFQREREEYCATTLRNAQSGSHGKRSWR
jgi:chorismate mutase